MVKPVEPSVKPAAAPITGDEFAQVIQRQIMNNEKAFKMFMDAQNKLYEQMVGKPASAAVPAPQGKAPVKFPNASKTCLYSREQVITMTDTSMAAVLGKQYEEVVSIPSGQECPCLRSCSCPGSCPSMRNLACSAPPPL